MSLTRLSLYRGSYYRCFTCCPGLTEATICETMMVSLQRCKQNAVIPMIASGELNPPKQGVYLSILCRVSVYKLCWPFKWYASKGEQEPKKFSCEMCCLFLFKDFSLRAIFYKKNVLAQNEGILGGEKRLFFSDSPSNFVW